MDFSVVVSQSDYVSAMNVVEKILKGRSRTSDGLLSFEGGKLQIEFPGGEVEIPVTGTWKGQVRVPLASLVHYARTMPEQESFPICVEGDRMRLGNTVFSCAVQPLEVRYPKLPLDAPVWTVLALRLNHSDATLATCGLLEKVQHAEKKRDRILAEAARLLAPLGIGPQDLRSLTQQIIEKRSRT